MQEHEKQLFNYEEKLIELQNKKNAIEKHYESININLKK